MFFPELIKSIKENDHVLEIGPGSLPHPRANVFLEKNFNEENAHEQRGLAQKIKLEKPIIYYDGNEFPFSDKEFDYVICSHVIEHVEDVDAFIKEMSRVAKNGYIEYPTIYYEYPYNFKVHLNFIKKQGNKLYWMPKKDSPLSYFQNVQNFFYKKLLYNHETTIRNFKQINFEGFEWHDRLESQKTDSLNLLTFTEAELEYFFKHKKRDGIIKQKVLGKIFLTKMRIKKIFKI